MRQEIKDIFKSEGVSEERARELVKEVGIIEARRKEVIALERAYRQKLISEGKGCAKCPRRDMLTTEHVIPKDLLYNFGIDVEHTYMPDNLILLCRPCNSLKSNRLDFALPQTKPMLLKLLERL